MIFFGFESFFVFWSVWKSLMYIMGELAGGGSVAVAVAVGVSDMWHVSSDMWHVSSDMWHMTHDMWHLILDTWQFFFFFFFFWVCFGIIVTIRTHQEIQCLPNAGFFYNWFWKLQIMAINVVYSFLNVWMTLKFCDQQKKNYKHISKALFSFRCRS